MNAILHRLFLACFLMITSLAFAQNPREQTRIDAGWRFSFGHPSDTEKDFGHGTAYFSYLAKTGNGDGPAASGFDDRAWRMLDLPQDWAVEQPFSEKGSPSHGFKAAGKGFPERSIGWYRKKITIAQADLGRIISLQFDGVYRNCKVWFNGHFLGTWESGYLGFQHDVTAYVNYGGENTIAVRVDASMEEGWYYEGAGIYRHVHLLKTDPLHVAHNGTYITSDIKNGFADVTARVTIENKGRYTGNIEIVQTAYDASGKVVASATEKENAPGFYKNAEFASALKISNPKLWDVDTPNLYRMVTQVMQDGRVVDSYETFFGIRSIRFDAEEGFFLNGKPLKLKGTNNHQDHAGVGTALPDGLQYFRIQKLKEMGSNAYRCSHHPPTPELLEACDRLGMLVIDETRLMGINDYHLGTVRQMIERDRNHPSVISWSVGNEEWMIEGNIMGERITHIMQDFAKSIDPTRPVSVGISSGFRSGISSMVEIMGYNYMGNGDIDAHRTQFPKQPGMGTEEGSTFATRGIYFDDEAKHYKSAYDRKPRPAFYSIEEGWKFYAERPYLAGMFIWTGFDYRGEPTPYSWPSVNSYFGMMDVCGFPKDNVYYLKSWWGSEPVLHIVPHWNWQGMEGKEIDVWVHSNCEEVELFLNKKSLGKKKMEKFGHLEWRVAYQPGTLEAVGYKGGKILLGDTQKSTGAPSKIIMSESRIPHVKDIKVLTISVADKNGLHVPTANDEIVFSVKGGRIMGVGNGDPTSLERDRFVEDIALVKIHNLEEQALNSVELSGQLPVFQDDKWSPAFGNRDYKNPKPAYAYRGSFDLGNVAKDAVVSLFYEKIGVESVIFINGQRVASAPEDPHKYILSADLLKEGMNTVHIIATPLRKVNDWDAANTNPGIIQVLTPAGQWKRRLFNGYAQVIVQPDGSGEDVEVTAAGAGLKTASVVMKGN
jgi:beta-galactosidase